MTIPEPVLVHRGAQPYVAVRRRLAMSEIGAVLPPLISEVAEWLTRKKIRPNGAPLWRYLVVDMADTLEVDVAFPVPALTAGDPRIVSDWLPEGRYATTVFIGDPDGLRQATADLLAWAEQRGIRWRMNGSRWGARIERYLSDPEKEPDRRSWKTELAFLIEED
jgi:effector-binding domain-containing protein